jgi:hypothetical protein
VTLRPGGVVEVLANGLEGPKLVAVLAAAVQVTSERLLPPMTFNFGSDSPGNRQVPASNFATQ